MPESALGAQNQTLFSRQSGSYTGDILISGAHHTGFKHNADYQLPGDMWQLWLLRLFVIMDIWATTGEKIGKKKEKTPLIKTSFQSKQQIFRADFRNDFEETVFSSTLVCDAPKFTASDDILIWSVDPLESKALKPNTLELYHSDLWLSKLCHFCFHGADHRLQRPNIDFLSWSQFSNLSSPVPSLSFQPLPNTFQYLKKKTCDAKRWHSLLCPEITIWK